MIKISFRQLRQAEHGYPGILKAIRHYEEASIPGCPSCGSCRVAVVGIGIVGRSLTLAAATDRLYLLANGPAPGSYWCRGCENYFGLPLGSGSPAQESRKLGHALFYSGKVTPDTAKDRPRAEGMIFETEAGASITDPPWVLVESALTCLDTGRGNSFAILSLKPNTYVQALRGRNGFHLEWRITGDSEDEHIHYRAATPEGSAESALLHKDDGHDEGQRCDLLDLESVIRAFRAFFDRQAPPESLHWRVLDL